MLFEPSDLRNQASILLKEGLVPELELPVPPLESQDFPCRLLDGAEETFPLMLTFHVGSEGGRESPGVTSDVQLLGDALEEFSIQTQLDRPRFPSHEERRALWVLAISSSQMAENASPQLPFVKRISHTEPAPWPPRERPYLRRAETKERASYGPCWGA